MILPQTYPCHIPRVSFSQTYKKKSTDTPFGISDMYSGSIRTGYELPPPNGVSILPRFKHKLQINIKVYCQRYDKAGGWTTIVIFKSKLPFGPALSSENYNVSHICNLKFSGGHTE